MPASTGERLLGLIADVQGLVGLPDFACGLLEAMLLAIPSDYATVSDLGPTPHSSIAVIRPELPRELVERFHELAHENPLVARYARTRDGRAYRFSDLVNPQQLHALEIYREIYGPLGVEHQIAFTLPTTPGRILAVVLSRSEHDYSEEERDLLNDARRFIIQAYRQSASFEAMRSVLDPDSSPMRERLRRAGLTQREAQVVTLIAYGSSNQDAARGLGVAERTIAKHLERSFAKLGVNDRSEAATRAWTLTRIDLPRPPIGQMSSAAGADSSHRVRAPSQEA